MLFLNTNGNGEVNRIDKLPIENEYIKISRFNERFWTKVVFVDTQNKIILGIIDNDLVKTSLHGLRCGEIITFHSSEIIECKSIES